MDAATARFIANKIIDRQLKEVFNTIETQSNLGLKTVSVARGVISEVQIRRLFNLGYTVKCDSDYLFITW